MFTQKFTSTGNQIKSNLVYSLSFILTPKAANNRR